MEQIQSFIESQKTVTLVVTEKCDLSCVYCYEHDKTGRQMKFQTAKQIIDEEIQNSSSFPLCYPTYC